MKCPNCSDSFTLLESIKYWLICNLPSPFYNWLDARSERSQLDRLKKLYSANAKLTPREHFVSFNRINGQSYESIAENMNVTRERIRQIQAKVLRKL